MPNVFPLIYIYTHIHSVLGGKRKGKSPVGVSRRQLNWSSYFPYIMLMYLYALNTQHIFHIFFSFFFTWFLIVVCCAFYASYVFFVLLHMLKDVSCLESDNCAIWWFMVLFEASFPECLFWSIISRVSFF
jgi:hypothetical protein